MKNRMSVLCTCVVVASAPLLDAQDRSQYRDLPLGSDLLSIARAIDVPPSEAKAIHQRPALMQELEWRPRYSVSLATRQADPVELVVFGFYDDQLYRVVVDYDRGRTEGLTNADMIEAISEIYGPPSKPTPGKKRVAAAGVDGDTPIARWADAESSVTLLRRPYQVTFRMIVVSTRLERLARIAGAEAVRLDARAAPQREVARQKKEVNDSRVTREQARVANKAAFKP
jgi:hypothetical protein